MNKKELEALRDEMDKSLSALEGIRDAAQEQFDELSEKQQEGPKGEKLKAEIDTLQEVYDNLETAVQSLSGLLEQ